jgi:hypothetical protein
LKESAELMTESKFQFGFSDLKLNVSRIKDILGYREGEDHGMIAGMVEEILAELADISGIKAHYRIFDDIRLHNENKSVEINGLVFNVKKIVFGQIKNSESFALFLCTAGEETGQRSRKAMQEDDLLKGYIYDVVGSEIVEAAADLMQESLRAAVSAEGMLITNRYSPGYCGWDVGEQHKLFSLFPGNHCGIRLTDSALMDPVKSVSGLIGIGKSVKMIPDTCSLCNMTGCIYRNRREKA